MAPAPWLSCLALGAPGWTGSYQRAARGTQLATWHGLAALWCGVLGPAISRLAHGCTSRGPDSEAQPGPRTLHLKSAQQACCLCHWADITTDPGPQAAGAPSSRARQGLILGAPRPTLGLPGSLDGTLDGAYAVWWLEHSKASVPGDPSPLPALTLSLGATWLQGCTVQGGLWTGRRGSRVRVSLPGKGLVLWAAAGSPWAEVRPHDRTALGREASMSLWTRVSTAPGQALGVVLACRPGHLARGLSLACPETGGPCPCGRGQLGRLLPAWPQGFGPRVGGWGMQNRILGSRWTTCQIPDDADPSGLWGAAGSRQCPLLSRSALPASLSPPQPLSFGAQWGLSLGPARGPGNPQGPEEAGPWAWNCPTTGRPRPGSLPTGPALRSRGS